MSTAAHSEGYLGLSTFGLLTPGIQLIASGPDIVLHAILGLLTFPYYIITFATSFNWIDARDMLSVLGTTFA